MSGAAVAVAETAQENKTEAEKPTQTTTEAKDKPQGEQSHVQEPAAQTVKKVDAPAAKTDEPPKDPAPAQPVPAAAKVEGEKKDEPKPADPAAPAAPVVPEKYELKVPDGSLLKPEHVAAIEGYAKATKRSNAEAQVIVEHQHAEHAALEQRRQGWLVELANDQQIGGEALKANAELTRRVIAKYAPESLKKTLDATGLGNHPDFFRMLVSLGKAAGEDVLDHPGAQDGSQNLDPAQVLFGQHNNK
jgi:hypothetical protein